MLTMNISNCVDHEELPLYSFLWENYLLARKSPSLLFYKEPLDYLVLYKKLACLSNHTGYFFTFRMDIVEETAFPSKYKESG